MGCNSDSGCHNLAASSGCAAGAAGQSFFRQYWAQRSRSFDSIVQHTAAEVDTPYQTPCNSLQWLCAVVQIFERKPTTVKNFGIWVRYMSRTGFHNMYKEYRDTTLNGAVEQVLIVRCPCRALRLSHCMHTHKKPMLTTPHAVAS